MTIFDDLEAEEDRLQGILDGLDEAQWASPSGAAGWMVADVVLHLAQSEEAALASATGAGRGVPPGARRHPGRGHGPARPGGAGGPRPRRSSGAGATPGRRRWPRCARPTRSCRCRGRRPAPLKPATLATTRLAEHWAHGLDITGPLGIAFPDTHRLSHIAWLAHRSLAVRLALAGDQPHEVFCELTAPDGVAQWRYGRADADSAISGPAGAFCRVAAQRLAPEESVLRVTGPHGATALRVLRTYAA